MPSIGTVDVEDVLGLASRALTELCNQLITSDLRRAGIPRNRVDLTAAETHPDGGIDAWIEWEGTHTCPPYVPGPLCGYQYKSGKFTPGASERELLTRDRRTLKEQALQLIERGGTYILVLSARDPNHQEKALYETHILNAVETALGHRNAHVRVYGATDLKMWAQEYTWAIAAIASLAGRAQPPTLRSFTEWSGMPAYQNPYVPLASTRDSFESMLGVLRNSGTVFRLDGLPGLGKTRLALEVARFLRGDGIGAAYIDTTMSSSAEILGMVINWGRWDTSGLLIVDNCDPALHAQLEGAVAGSDMSILTIDYNRRELYSSAAVVYLDRHPPAEIYEIVAARYAGLAQMDVERIVSYCDGWPLLALRLADGIVANRDVARELPDDVLMLRILGIQRTEVDALRVIRAFSLFEHVGFEEPYTDQIQYVRTRLCGNMDQMLFDEIVGSFRGRGILVTVGRLLRITPPPMAVRLATEWMRLNDAAARDLLLDHAMPPRLAEYLARQFEHLDTVQDARGIAERLLELHGPFDNAEILKTKRGARIFRALAAANAVAATHLLRHVFSGSTHEELIALSDGRRDLVFTLERLLFPRETFASAALTLAKLAAAETEQISNNATGVLTSAFVIGAQNEADAPARVAVIDALVESNDPNLLLLAAQCVRAGLATGSSVTYLINPPALDREVRIWQPQSQDEINEYRGLLNARAKNLVQYGGPVGLTIQQAVARSIRWLVAARRLNELEDMVLTVARFVPNGWKEAIEELRASVNYDLSGAPDQHAEEAVEALLSRLEPQDLLAQARMIISDPPSELRMTERGTEDVAELRARQFGAKVWREGSLDSVLPLLVTGTQQRAVQFGESVIDAAGDSALRAVDEILVATRDAESNQRNVGVLAGALGSLASLDREHYRSIVARIAADEALQVQMPLLIAVAGPDDSDIRLVTQLLRRGSIRAESILPMAYGKALAGASQEVISEMLEVMLEKGGFAPAFVVADMQTVGAREARVAYEALIERALMGYRIGLVPLAGVHDWSAIEWSKRLLSEPSHEAFAEALARDIFGRAAETDVTFEERRRLSEFVPALLGRYRDVAWFEFTREYEKASGAQRYWLLLTFEYLPAGSTQRRLALDELEPKFLLQSCRRYPDVLPIFLAQHGALFSTDAEKEMHPTPLLDMLLNDFGESAPVRRGIVANLHSFLSVGSRGDYYERRIRLIDRMPTFGRQSIIEWLAEVRAELSVALTRERKNDEEFKGGAW